MSNEQQRIIQEQLQANERMIRRNAQSGRGIFHGQSPINERFYQLQQPISKTVKSVDSHGNVSKSAA